MEIDSFFQYLSSEKRSSVHTLDAYRNDLEQFGAFVHRTFETDSPSEITTVMVRSWMAQLAEESYAATSVHRKMSSVNAFFRFLLKQGALHSNPAKGLTKPKKPRRLPTFVEERATKELYDSFEAMESHDFPSQRDALIMAMFYETGIRLSELIQLEDRDIDFSIGQIKVTGKRNKMRYVPVSSSLLARIKSYKMLRMLEAFEFPVETFFVTDLGKKPSKSFVYSTVKTYLSRVTTVRKKSPHVMRHTFATHMLNNGAELNVIKEILGHSSLAATQVYTHNSIEKLKGIHSKMHPRNNNV